MSIALLCLKKDMQRPTIDTVSKELGVQFQTKGYSKVQDNLRYQFITKEVTPFARLIYYSLIHSLLSNSSISKATYPYIRETTGISSDSTIKKYLDELKQKGFLSYMGNSHYRLWCSVFKGYLENTPNTPQPEDCVTTRGVVKTTTPRVVTHVRVYKTKHKNNKQQQRPAIPPNPQVTQPKKDDVFLKPPLSFCLNSPFKTINPKTMAHFVQTHGLEQVQTKITKLETIKYNHPSTITKTAAGLLYKALHNGDIWDFQDKQEKEHKNKARKQQEKQAFARLKQEQQHQQEEQNNNEDILYNKAIQDKTIVNTASELLRLEEPELEPQRPELFQARLRYRILTLYQKRAE